MALTFEQARQKLAKCNQEHILQFWDQLSTIQRKTLCEQIEELDPDILQKMQRLLHSAGGETSSAHAAAIEPVAPEQVNASEQEAARIRGEEALRHGTVGVLLVAGGQGTRLGFEGPKGTFHIGPVSKASLFAIHARKVLALRRRYRASIPFYIMTSQANDAETRAFFAQHAFFGLPPEDVLFFSQGMYVALWPDGRIVMEAPNRLFRAPDGHGGILAALKRTGMLGDMHRRGLETLFYFQVDNPLVSIADPAFLGLHLRRNAEMSIKVCAKRDPEEGMGVVVRRDGHYAMVEYTELTREQKYIRTAAGDLLFKHGSVAIHVFSLPFLQREADAGLPIHSAHKKVPYCDEQGRLEKPAKPNAYKFEKFIFDALPDAHRVVVVDFAREEEFSPVKNATGVDSPESSRRDMMEKFARWMAACGIAVPRKPDGSLVHLIDIDPCFALDATDLKQRLPPGFAWSGDLDLQAD